MLLQPCVHEMYPGCPLCVSPLPVFPPISSRMTAEKPDFTRFHRDIGKKQEVLEGGAKNIIFNSISEKRALNPTKLFASPKPTFEYPVAPKVNIHFEYPSEYPA